MNARLTANLVFGLALGAVAGGCTVHTYSARPEYPSSSFASRGTDRYDVSFRTERRPSQRQSVRPQHDDSYHPASRHDSHVVATADKPRPTTKPSATKPSATKPSATKPSKPRDGDHVALRPAAPEKAEPRKRKLLSFHERVEKLVEKKNEEIAQREKERSKRMRSVIGAAANQND
jgi:hypothetical protein